MALRSRQRSLRTGLVAVARVRAPTRARWPARLVSACTRLAGLRFGSETIAGAIAPELLGAAVWAMPGVAATEESSASRPSGVAFKRNPRDRVLASKCAHAQHRRRTPIILKIRQDNIPDGERLTVTAVAAIDCLRPMAGTASYSRHIGAPRPTRSRVTMTGSRFPGSRVVASDHLPRDLSVSSGMLVVS